MLSSLSSKEGRKRTNKKKVINSVCCYQDTCTPCYFAISQQKTASRWRIGASDQIRIWQNQTHVLLQNNVSTFRKETTKKKQAWRTKETLEEVMSKNFRYVQERDDLSKTIFHKRPRWIRGRGTWVLQVCFEIWSNKRRGLGWCLNLVGDLCPIVFAPVLLVQILK